MLLGFLIHSYVDCDYCLTHHYAHILSFALPPTYGLVCTVTTISLSALDAGFLLHPNRCTASHNLNHLVSPLSIVSAIEQLFHPALPCKLVLFCFCTPPHLSNSRQGRSSLCWVSLYDRSQWFQSLLWDISIPSQHLWPQKNGLVTCPPLFARSFIPFDLFHHPMICPHTLFTATATLHDLSVKHSLSQRIA